MGILAHTVQNGAFVIVGGVQYIYLHLIMGYSNYTSRLVEALTDNRQRTAPEIRPYWL